MTHRDRSAYKTLSSVKAVCKSVTITVMTGHVRRNTQAEPATVVNRTGWHGSVFATSNWTIGAADEPHHFVGQLSGSPTLQESGSLSDWQTYVGQLCRGNLLAIFCKAGFVVEEQVQGLI